MNSASLTPDGNAQIETTCLTPESGHSNTAVTAGPFLVSTDAAAHSLLTVDTATTGVHNIHE